METGKKLRYDVKELIEHPEKLTKAYKEYEEENLTQNQPKRDWAEWEKYRKTLGKLLEKTYPLKKKETEAMEPT